MVLVEADGAKRLPLKAPAEYEPVIPLRRRRGRRGGHGRGGTGRGGGLPPA
ncbi:MAG: hypothetical protein ACLRIS_12285 [Flavonifractor plautii]